MRNIITIITVLIGLYSYAQDTIFVSHDKTTTLVFDQTIQFSDIGNHKFGSSSEGNSIFLKATSELKSSDNTTLLIKEGENYFNTIIAYKKDPSITFHDFRYKGENIDNSIGGNTKSTSTPEYIVNHETLKQFMTSENRFQSVGQVKNKILVSFQNMETSGEEMKVKILVKNLSGSDYEIDFTKFEFVESKGQGLFRKKNREKRTVLDPLWTTPNKIIPEYDEVELYYILPKYATNFNGKLKIGIWEKNGGRTIEFLIPSKYIL